MKIFVVDPAQAPRPTFRYRLLPLESDRTPGDAAPVYLRIRHELDSARLKAIDDNYVAWVQPPDGKLNLAEARAFVDQWKKVVEQIGFGARRKTCDWAYTLPEQRLNAIEILLPDAQGMRTWCRLLMIRAQVEIVEGKYDEAIRTIETGIGFARHVGEGPFLINGLVGIAMATEMISRAEGLVARPGAPNLYWALTALPRPLVDLRGAVETEYRMGEYLVPELDDLDRPRTEAEWSSLYLRLIERLDGLRSKYKLDGAVSGLATLPARTFGPAAFKARFLDEARRAAGGRPATAGPMTDDRALVLLVADRYRELRDVAFRPAYLPFPTSAPAMAEAEARLKAEQSGPAGVLAALMSEQVKPSLDAQVRLDRRVAALRVVEALRMHAASNDGKLPASLADVTVVPIPPDPVTGKPFEYRLDGDTAVLVGPGDRIAPPWIHYRGAFRK